MNEFEKYNHDFETNPIKPEDVPAIHFDIFGEGIEASKYYNYGSTCRQNTR